MIQTREVLVSAVEPHMTPDWHLFALTLRWREGDEWVIVRHGISYMDADGDMSWKNFGDEAWVKAHVFPYAQALTIALTHMGEVRVNGFVAHKVAAQWAADRLAALAQEEEQRAHAEQGGTQGVGGSATAAPDVPELGS